MTEMAPEQPLPEEGEAIPVQAEGIVDNGTLLARWGIPGSVLLEIRYKIGEEPLIPGILEIAQGSWENVHEMILEAIEARQEESEAQHG